MSSMDMMSPMRSQPTKKQRSGATPASRQRGPPPSKISVEADDAIARRRAELRRLQQQRIKRFGSSTRSNTVISSKTTTTTELLANRSNTKAAAAAPSALSRGRTSSTKKGAPPPPVARKLDFPSAQSRAKSVPPRRPPPPPSRPAPPNEAPATVPDTLSQSRNKIALLGRVQDGKKDERSLLLLKRQGKHSKLLQDRTTKLKKERAIKDLLKEEISPAAFDTKDPPKLVPELSAKTPAASEKLSLESTTPAPNATVQDIQTPDSISSTTVEPPSTVRRDRLREFRQGLDSPFKTKTAASDMKILQKAAHPNKKNEAKKQQQAPSNNSITETSLSKELLEIALKRTETERNQALQQIKVLEDKLSKTFQQAPMTPIKDLATLQRAIDMAKVQGEEKALKWASKQFSNSDGNSKSVGLLSPAIPSTPLGNAFSKRTATPHPKRHGMTRRTQDGRQVPVSDEDLERQFIASFREAITYIPHEYHSLGKDQQCTFFVRRPYGTPAQNDIFDLVSPQPHEAYSKRAHVSDPTTIDLAVAIPYDDSVLCLFDTSAVRYRITPTGPLETITTGELLGAIRYIDDTANEQEYSLDLILEEALQVRQQYCSTMMTTALGFSQRKVSSDNAPVASKETTLTKAETNEIGVDTADIPVSVPKEVRVDDTKSKKATKEEKQSKMEDDNDDSSAADVLTVFIGIILKSIFSFLWWLVVGLPIATVKTSITYILAFAILGTIYLYGINEHHGHLLERDESFLYTSLQYHANAAVIL